MEYEFIRVTAAEDWEVYHRIRREELFEARNRVGVYDSNHPDELLSANFPFLLKLNGVGIGTVRLDIRKDKSAVIRLVAITKQEQGKGHGRKLENLVEDFACKKGIIRLLVNSHPSAVGYYQKLGFVEEGWDVNELKGISKDAIQMSKELLCKS